MLPLPLGMPLIAVLSASASVGDFTDASGKVALPGALPENENTEILEGVPERASTNPEAADFIWSHSPASIEPDWSKSNAMFNPHTPGHAGLSFALAQCRSESGTVSFSPLLTRTLNR